MFATHQSGRIRKVFMHIPDQHLGRTLYSYALFLHAVHTLKSGRLDQQYYIADIGTIGCKHFILGLNSRNTHLLPHPIYEQNFQQFRVLYHHIAAIGTIGWK